MADSIPIFSQAKKESKIIILIPDKRIALIEMTLCFMVYFSLHQLNMLNQDSFGIFVLLAFGSKSGLIHTDPNSISSSSSIVVSTYTMYSQFILV